MSVPQAVSRAPRVPDLSEVRRPEGQAVFAPLDESVRRARHHVENVLRRRYMAEMAETAGLVVSELVANAVKAHQGLCVDDPVIVQIGFSASGPVILEVMDVSDEPPVVQNPGIDQENGRGLLLVSALTEDFGHMPLKRGKVVWAVVR